ncbi:MAG TPA: MgtC/SapB family protein [Capsulimonadaceae bacterium]
MSAIQFLDHNTAFIARMILAVLIGGCIGIEREISGRPAGFRTHILVCLGSCLIAMIDTVVPNTGGRIAAQVVTGVGFLGAGTILRSDRGNSVHGLTTAASIWATAGIGISLGFGPPMMWFACVAAVLALLTLSVAGVFEDAVLRHNQIHRITVTVTSPAETGTSPVADLIACLASMNAKVRSLEIDDENSETKTRTAHARIKMPRDQTRETVAAEIAKLKNISDIIWDN